MIITVTSANNNPNTIDNRLEVRLGRRPTNEELKAEWFRILNEVKQ